MAGVNQKSVKQSAWPRTRRFVPHWNRRASTHRLGVDIWSCLVQGSEHGKHRCDPSSCLLVWPGVPTIYCPRACLSGLGSRCESAPWHVRRRSRSPVARNLPQIVSVKMWMCTSCKKKQLKGFASAAIDTPLTVRRVCSVSDNASQVICN